MKSHKVHQFPFRRCYENTSKKIKNKNGALWEDLLWFITEPRKNIYYL